MRIDALHILYIHPGVKGFMSHTNHNGSSILRHLKQELSQCFNLIGNILPYADRAWNNGFEG